MTLTRTSRERKRAMGGTMFKGRESREDTTKRTEKERRVGEIQQSHKNLMP